MLLAEYHFVILNNIVKFLNNIVKAWKQNVPKFRTFLSTTVLP